MVDSGADANVISESDFQPIERDFDKGIRELFDVDSEPSVNISGYAATAQLRVICSFKAWVEVIQEQASGIPKKPRTFAEFFVVRGGGRSLLGRATAYTMKLLQVGLQVNAISSNMDKSEHEFPSVPNVIVDFDIDESIPGVHRSYVSIPAHFYEPAIKRIEEMERTGIIERVYVPGKWLSGLSAVPKGKGDMRLVVNMTGPNRAISRQVHPMPRFEEIQLKLHKAKKFAKLDVSSAFFHLKLSDRSKAMTVFKAPSASGFKMYQYTRLVFGVNCAPEIFQREMERIMDGIPGLIIYIDDILVAAETSEELEEITKAVIQRMKENNLTINLEKCEFNKDEITFLGHKVSEKGFHIDDQKVQDIRCFREPRTSLELKSFIGLASFVRGFIRNFAELALQLRPTENCTHFVWGPQQQKAFEKIKREIISCTVSQGFFSTGDKTELYTDASMVAIGAVLVQVNGKGVRRIISFASKSLTATERRYPQPQREALAIVWGTEHFHYYTLGACFTIKTDAEGISFIFDKANVKLKRFVTRAEGWAMRLSTFNYTVEFVKGEDNIADSSSRLFQSSAEPVDFDEGEMPCEIANVQFTTINDIAYGEDHMPIQQVRMETARCVELQGVIRAMETQNWPEHLKLYQAAREDLAVVNGVLSRLGLIVPPVNLRPKAVDIAHKGHHGMSKTKSVLKEVMWWPRMYRAVEDWVAGCRTCILTGRSEETVPMQRTILPEGSWDYVAMDFCGPFAAFGGVHVIVIIDYFSRYAVAAIVKSTGWKHLLPVFEEVFGRLGLPKTMKSDNGAPFNGDAYKKYCVDHGIDRVNSFPEDPKQNGMAEAAMKHVNAAAQHASVEGIPLAEALRERVMAHNDSEHRETREVPSHVLWGRRLRRNLPSLRPTHEKVDVERMRAQDFASKQDKKQAEDRRRHAKETVIVVGDKVVLLRPDKRKGQTRFGPDEWTVKKIRQGDLTLVLPNGTETMRNITKVKRLPESNTSLPRGIATQGSQALWSPQAEDQRLPSPVLPPPVRDSESQRPPSPFLTSAMWSPDQTMTPAAPDSQQLATPAPVGRPKRKVQPPARLKDCVLNAAEKIDD
jgi:RNase H-like domain found in reverse transcriptase/Reverse transcriptase (RNA-dependent DNA polymerase)/Integrase zinc binding domain/Integrase core domain